MRVFNCFDEVKSAVGTQVGTSDWIEITQDRIDKFADATSDEHWIHVDHDRAKHLRPLSATFVSGNTGMFMTLSLCLAGWLAVPQ
jgi:acyl dehydratase